MVVVVDKDLALLPKLFPDQVKFPDEDEVPREMFINGFGYCFPALWTIYAGLLLATAWNAQCLFSNRVYNYCRYKFGLTNFPSKGDSARIAAFSTVFETYVPNTPILHHYAYASDDKCSICVREKDCKDTYLSSIESNVKKILSWRNYDEIQQIKSVIDDIIKKRDNLGGVIDPSDILHDFRDKENRIRKSVKLVFPKVKRWANITAIISIPMGAIGVATGNPLITIPAVSLIGLSKSVEKFANMMLSKYSWIGFLNKNVELYQKEQHYEDED